MKTQKLSLGLVAIALASFAVARCGSNTTESVPDGSTGPVLYPLSTGPYCYDVTGVSGVVDGCGIAPASVVGTALPGTYDQAAQTFTLGTEGSLGVGVLSNNTGTLLRDGTTSDSSAPSCTWHQTDTTTITMMAQNMFTASVVETEDTFAAACGAASTPCTSSWTWTMSINAAKSPTSGCQ
jgi:hypothetical protein